MNASPSAPASGNAVTCEPPVAFIPRMGRKDSVVRFGISLPADLADHLDRTVARRGFKNRSQAITEMLRAQLSETEISDGTASTAGTISLVYDHRKRNLQSILQEIQHRYYLLIVTSMHVHLENHNYMEVLLVQGPQKKLQELADELTTCKGVKHAKLQLTAVGIPPLL
jgi:CopG family transcriptional regulator, nickel-responsive regulator